MSLKDLPGFLPVSMLEVFVAVLPVPCWLNGSDIIRYSSSGLLLCFPSSRMPFSFSEVPSGERKLTIPHNPGNHLKPGNRKFRPLDRRTICQDWADIFRFLFNRNIISLISLSSIPAAIAVVGFLNYFSPIYLNRIGASQSNLDVFSMIYGVCLIYVAPFISKYIDDIRESKKEYIAISGVLGSVAFRTFYFFEGVVPTAVAVLLLGISTSFDASRAYALQLNVTHELGAGKALGIFASAIRAGQMLGPIIFGWLIFTIEINKAITYFGLGYPLLTTFFIVIAQNDRKIAVTRTSQQHD